MNIPFYHPVLNDRSVKYNKFVNIYIYITYRNKHKIQRKWDQYKKPNKQKKGKLNVNNYKLSIRNVPRFMTSFTWIPLVRKIWARDLCVRHDNRVSTCHPHPRRVVTFHPHWMTSAHYQQITDVTVFVRNEQVLWISSVVNYWVVSLWWQVLVVFWFWKFRKKRTNLYWLTTL